MQTNLVLIANWFPRNPPLVLIASAFPRCRVPGTKEVPPQRLPGVKPGKMSSEQWELGSLSYSLLHFQLRSGIDYIPNMNQHQDYHDGVSQKTGRWLTYLDGWRV